MAETTDTATLFEEFREEVRASWMTCGANYGSCGR